MRFHLIPPFSANFLEEEMNPIVLVMYVIGNLIRQIRNSTLKLELTYELHPWEKNKRKYWEENIKKQATNTCLLTAICLFYIIFVLFWYSKLVFSLALWTMISEDKENVWTSDLIKKSNNDTALLLSLLLATITLNNIKLSLSTKSSSFIRSCGFLTLKDLYITKNFES